MAGAGVLWKKEMHTFAEHGQSVAFDVVDLNTWLMSSVERDVLLAIDGRVSESTIVERLCKCYPAGEVQAAIETWRARDVLLDHEPQPVFIKEDCPDVPTFMTLNLAQVCNLRCRYCFADAGTYGQTAMMSRKVACASVDMLMRYSGEEKHCSILFFGGEPLLNMDTLSYIIEYAREQAKVYGKSVHFSLITNGTLLTPQNVDYLVHQRVRVEISIDGPAKFHDRCRVFGDGRGSHVQVAAGARMLCEKSRWPVAANATLTHHHSPLKGMVAHFESLGFGGSGIKLCVLPEEMQGVLSEIALTTRDIAELQEECREYVYDLVAQAEFKPAFPQPLWVSPVREISGKPQETDLQLWGGALPHQCLGHWRCVPVLRGDRCERRCLSHGQCAGRSAPLRTAQGHMPDHERGTAFWLPRLLGTLSMCWRSQLLRP